MGLSDHFGNKGIFFGEPDGFFGVPDTAVRYEGIDLLSHSAEVSAQSNNRVVLLSKIKVEQRRKAREISGLTGFICREFDRHLKQPLFSKRIAAGRQRNCPMQTDTSLQ